MLTTKRILFSVTLLLGLSLLIGGCGGETVVTRMSPGDVPGIEQAAIDAFKDANDVEVTGVMKEEEGGKVVYEVEMLVDGVMYEVEVSENGEILETEKGNDDDDGDNDDDDDEGDD